MTRGRAAIPVLAPVLLMAAGVVSQAVRLDRLPDARPGARLPPGWEVREVGDAPAAESRVVVPEGGSPWLRFDTGGGGAGQFWLELDEPLDPDRGRLAWTWRVDLPVTGARLRDPALDDSPARLFVVFGERGLVSPPRTVFYTWGGGPPDTSFFRSHVSDRLAVTALRGRGDPAGVWLTESRSPGDDFRAAFGRTPPPIRAVGFMIDTDQTGAPARSGLSGIRWVPDG